MSWKFWFWSFAELGNDHLKSIICLPKTATKDKTSYAWRQFVTNESETKKTTPFGRKAFGRQSKNLFISQSTFDELMG
jgi:hypothetical protein